MSVRKVIFGVVFLGFFLNGCGRQESSQRSQLREVPSTERIYSLPVGTVLKLKRELRLLPGATDLYFSECGFRTQLNFDSSDRERVLKAGFSFVVTNILNESEGSSDDSRKYDYTAIHVANLSNTFKAKILGLKGWNAKFNNGTTDYIGVGVAKISELLTTFDIEQPAPIVIGE